MRRPSLRALRTGIALAILAAAACGAVGAGEHLAATLGLTFACMAGACCAVLAAVSDEPRRRACWWLLAGSLGLLAGSTLGTHPWRPLDDESWLQQQTARAGHRLALAAPRNHEWRDVCGRLVEDRTASAQRADQTDDDPFAIGRTILTDWSQAGEGRSGDDLAIVVWRDGRRVGWAGPAAATHRPPTGLSPQMDQDDGRVILRLWFAPQGERTLVIEGQMGLAAVEDPTAQVHDGGDIQRQVVRDDRSPERRSIGDARRGLRVVQDVVLGPADTSGAQLRLRLSVQVPARTMLEGRDLARLAVLRHLLLGLAILVWSAAVGGAAGFWAGAWLVRWAWVKTDLMRGLTLLLPSLQTPAGPDHPASLLDPAYFATTYGDGWLASGADALLSALLFAGTARWLWRRWRPSGLVAITPRRMLRLAPWLASVFLALWGLQRLWEELAANANARLIGLQVPFEAWTFWALHAVILLISLGAGLLLLLLASRLLGGVPATLRSSARPFWFGGGLLVLVVFNHASLSQVYERAEREWLVRKADRIVQPQDDWIGFLLEDVLGEMAAADAVVSDPREAKLQGVGSLRRSLPAYRLWRRSAVHDLGLPRLVEICDARALPPSQFATGFLRDAQFEVLKTGPWFALTTDKEDADGPTRSEVLLQTEMRRYPSGRERILRGEIQRGAGRGWLRLELPVQSWRVATLGGDHAPQIGRRSSGYRPRREVERPLLLLLGHDRGWLDVGFGDLPDEQAERRIAALRSGAERWAAIDLDGSRWLCRWAPLPEGHRTHPGEGFLVGLQQPGIVDVLLDIGRLLLLNVILLGISLLVFSLLPRRRRWHPGFQGRFLLGYLAIGVVLLIVAGSLADRQTFQRIDQEARARARDGLITAMGQLQGLLTEQARALAGSEYLDDLLSSRLGPERPLGPQSVRQGMVFAADGQLLLDETLSDLDVASAQRLLAAAREGPLAGLGQQEGLYLGVLIPLDLPARLDPEQQGGTLFYRQRIDDQLLPALAEVIGGEITLRFDGEVVEASHPGRVLGGQNPLLATPEQMTSFRSRPGQPVLQAMPRGLAFTGGIALPALVAATDGGFERLELPAVLAVDFPARERDYLAQRRRMALFLAGLITLLLLTAFGLALVLTWNIFEPLRVLLAATQRLAAGDYAAPLPPAGADEVGRLAAGFQTMRDRLQKARAVLAERERFLQAVLDQVPVGVVVWDARGRLASWNPAAEAILERFYPDLPAGHRPADWAVRLRGDVRGSLLPEGGALSSEDGSRTLRVGLAPLELGAAAPHELLVCEDLTEFLAAKKLALNAELARQVAHEIKNPLTPIQLSAQLLLQAYQDRHPHLDSIVADAVQRIVEQVELLRAIAGEFSLLGRPGELACEPLDLADLVRGVVARYQGAATGAGPRVVIDEADLPPVLGHRESLAKVLGNLMQNSLDAAGGPGALELSVRWRIDERTVTMVWADNGSGIDADVAARLFDPYFSTKSRGTGLGLAICRNLLDMMGGRIGLANRTAARGAVATLTLPRAPQDGPTERAATT